MSQNIKQIIISIVIIVVAFIGFKAFFAPEEGPSLSADKNAKTFADGQAILKLLKRLEEVTLDASIFSSAVFNSLSSFEKDIPTQAIARPNPFAPIGTDSDAR
jgi:hypothetical protein